MTGLQKLLTAAGAAAGALTAILAFWTDWGWIPGKQYRAEHVSETSADEIADRLQSFMDTWQCDEWSEEIPELNKAVDRLQRRVELLEDGSVEHDRLSSIYYQRRQELLDKQDAYDEADCEKLVK